jgi:hypothetical protein
MAELYAGRSLDSPRQAPLAKTLPTLTTLTRLSGMELTVLGLDQLDAGLYRLRAQLEAANVRGVDTSTVRAAIDATASGATASGATASGAATGDIGEAGAVREQIAALHVQTMLALTAADFRLGKAYGLGRSLADTANVPRDRDSLEYFFGPRLDAIKGWLADLASAFPAHASQAVAASLTAWDQWAADPRIDGLAMDWERHGPAVLPTLQHQGRLWRALLSGEKEGTAMLTTDDLVDAGQAMVSRAARLAGRSIVSFAPLVAGVVLLIASGVSLLVLARSDVLRVVGSILAALGSMGLTWKQVTASAGRLAGGLEWRLWSAELDRAIAVAITAGPAGWGIDVAEVSKQLPAAGEGPHAESAIEVIREFSLAVSENRVRESQVGFRGGRLAGEDRLHPYVCFLPTPGDPGSELAGRTAVLEWLGEAANREVFGLIDTAAPVEPGCFMTTSVARAPEAQLWRVRHGSVTRWERHVDEASARGSAGLAPVKASR